MSSSSPESQPVVDRPVVKNGYIAHYNGMRIEIRAETLYQAVCAARDEVRRRLGKRKPNFDLLAVALAEKGDEPVTHDPSILPGA